MLAEVTPVFGAVEGDPDEVVLRRLVHEAGGRVEAVYGKTGKADLLRQLKAYNHAAVHAPWVVLVDLDRSADCPPPVLPEWLPTPAPLMCFRIVVRAIEAWLMADRERMAAFMGVPYVRVPHDPESLENPKDVMVSMASRSRHRAIVADMVPRPGSGRNVGPAYTSRLIEFATGLWRPDIAAERAESLQRSRAHLERMLRR
jgi:hypothetical protein